MAKNDTVLLDAIISQRAHEDRTTTDIGETFERFVFEQILKDYDLSSDDIESCWIDGRHDGGIDGFYIFVNGRLLTGIEGIQWPKDHGQLHLYVISCKHHDTFKEATINSVLATSNDIFDLSRERSSLSHLYSDDLLDIRDLLSEA